MVAAQVILTPLIALWSIWVGDRHLHRMSDVRAAQQLSALGNLPLVALTTLISLNVVHATPGLAVGRGAALVVIDRFGWRIVAKLFDRERLITGTR